MAYWINTYHPLAATPHGPWAQHDPPLPPYVDASCRREPDFQAERPAITGLCRPAAVRHLHEGDVVAYFTVKRPYGGDADHRRLAAVLRVISEAKSHAAADRWYEQHGIARPRNIMVPGNPPLALEATEGGYRENGKIVLPTSPADAPRVLAHWDNLYQQRRYKVGDVRICEPLVVNVQCGYPFPERFVNEVFGNSGFPDTEWHPVEVLRDIMRAVLTAVGRSDVADML